MNSNIMIMAVYIISVHKIVNIRTDNISILFRLDKYYVTAKAIDIINIRNNVTGVKGSFTNPPKIFPITI